MSAASTDHVRTMQRFDAPALSEDDSVRVLARHDASSARRRHDAGFRQGYEEGASAGSAQVEAAIADHRASAARLSHLCGALEAAIAERRSTDAALLAQVDDAVIATALHIAEAVIGREVTDHGAVVEVIQRALAESSSDLDGDVVIHLHPEDVGCAAEAIDAGLIRGLDAVEVVPDPTVDRGGCLVDAGSLHVDARLGATLDRVRAALGAA